jgi:hypothetical protein
MRQFLKRACAAGIVSFLILLAAGGVAFAAKTETATPFTAQELDQFLLDVPQFLKWQAGLNESLAKNQKLNKEQLEGDLRSRLRLAPERFLYILGRVHEVIGLTLYQAAYSGKKPAGAAADIPMADLSKDEREALKKEIQEKLKAIPPAEIQLIESRLNEILKSGLGQYLGIGSKMK